MAEGLLDALNAVVNRVAALAAEDAQLRSELRGLAQAILAATEERQAEVSQIQPLVDAPLPPPHEGEVALPAPPLHEPLPTAPGIEVPIGWANREESSDADLPIIEARCRMKAEGARWAIARQRRIQEGASYYTEIEPKDREIVEKAKKLPDCFLWMNHPSGPSPSVHFDDLAGCFEAVADALTLVRGLLEDLNGNREFFEQSLDLLAEAQSALRSAIIMVDGARDGDQQRVYQWLRAVAAQQQVFIQRYMRIDDSADPTSWPEIDERIEALDGKLQAVRQRAKQRQARIKQLRYHATRIKNGSGTDHDWKKVVETVEQIVADGVPPSNREVRELLLPIIDEMPDLGDLPESFRLVLREIDRFLTTSTTAPNEFIQEPTTEVRKVAQLLAGKSVVLIGGERRPDAYAALKSTFSLKELLWIETRDHEPTELFEPFIARDEVVLVLLAIRWTSHSYGDVRQYCVKYGKALVRLPGGYNPNQVAFQILQQRGISLENGRN